MRVAISVLSLGSANLNQRSMAADSEINIASDCLHTTRELRERVIRRHSGDKVSGGAGGQPARRQHGSAHRC